MTDRDVSALIPDALSKAAIHQRSVYDLYPVAVTGIDAPNSG